MAGCFCLSFFSRRSSQRSRTLQQTSKAAPVRPRPAANHSGWATLPPNLLNSIARRLPVTEHVRLSAVCTSWANSLKNSNPFFRANHPWLMLTPYTDEHVISLVDPEEGQSCHLPLLLESQGKVWCVGSKDGWLVVTCKLNILLLNPITGERVPLPSFFAQPGVDLNALSCVNKVILSAVPKPGTSRRSIVAMAICADGNVAYAKASHRKWTQLPVAANNVVRDIVCHDGMLCVLCSGPVTHVYSAEFTGRYRQSQISMVNLDASGYNLSYEYVDQLEEGCLYLVSSPTGDLLQVLGVRSNGQKCTKFVVMAFRTGSGSLWTEVEDLGNWSLFVDTVQCTMQPAADVAGIKENSVYVASNFVNSNNEVAIDAGVFDMRTGTIESGLSSNLDLENLRSIIPLWFKPSLSKEK